MSVVIFSQGRDVTSWGISVSIACILLSSSLHVSHVFCCLFVQICLASRYIHMHASDMPPKVVQVNLQLHICAKALWYHDGISMENQPILYGQLVARAKVRQTNPFVPSIGCCKGREYVGLRGEDTVPVSLLEVNCRE